MLAFKEYFVDKVLSDATLRGYLANTAGGFNIYPVGVDLQPEQFPAVTFADVGGTILSRPQGMRVAMFQVDVWGITTSKEVETIYRRIAQILNFRDSTTDGFSNGTLYWVRENGDRDASEAGRRLWRKSTTFKYWAANNDFL